MKVVKIKYTGIFILLLVGFLLMQTSESCKKKTAKPVTKLEKVQTFNLTILEPSGLSFGRERKTLLIASDKTNKIFETDLKGNILVVLDYKGEDIEGVAYDKDNDLITIVEEEKREVVQLNYEGDIQNVYTISKPENAGENGLEGISYHAANKTFYILNEDKPGLLYTWNPTQGITSTTHLHFASDYSSIYADAQNPWLWIVSDKDKALFKCDYKGNKISHYQLDKNKYEGVVIDYSNNLIYLVNDESSELTIFKFKTEYYETK